MKQPDDFLLGLLELVLLGFWIAAVVLGIRTAIAKGRSPAWMWFGLNPVGALVVWLVMLRLKPLRRCAKCMKKSGAGAAFCEHCGGREFLSRPSLFPGETRFIAPFSLPAGPEETVFFDPSGRPYASRGGSSVWLPEPISQAPDGHLYAVRNYVATPLTVDEAARIVRAS